MSVTSVVNLNDGLLGQQSTQRAQGLLVNNAASPHAPISALPQDQFTPSSLNESASSTAQAAGLFTAPPVSALPLNVPPATSQTGDAATSGPSASNANAQSGPTLSDNATSAAPTAAGSVSQQTQLNTLNNALAALGLSAANIRQIDRVASVINDFNPTAFTSLAYQLEAQAQKSTGPTGSAQNTQSAIAGASTVGTASTSNVAKPPALQSFPSSSQFGSNGQSAQAQASETTTRAQTEPKAAAATV
ncbi:MAG: hypothetical protein JO119_17675 [Acidobacteria bacterium]|nr:hypothetical protein [Acidobacteriota bacterium]